MASYAKTVEPNLLSLVSKGEKPARTNKQIDGKNIQARSSEIRAAPHVSAHRKIAAHDLASLVFF